MATFAQLPQDVQNAFMQNSGFSPADFQGTNFVQGQAVGYQGIWIAPHLCYDFNESNYGIITLNLQKVMSLDTGPAMAVAYTKIDPNAPAWILVDGGADGAGKRVFSCV